MAEKNEVKYADRQGFEGFAIQFADETRGITELEGVDEWADELSSMLYTYRSIARALPTGRGYAALHDGVHETHLGRVCVGAGAEGTALAALAGRSIISRRLLWCPSLTTWAIFSSNVETAPHQRNCSTQIQKMVELESTKSRQCLKSQVSKQMMQMHRVEKKTDDEQQQNKNLFSFAG